MSALVKKEIRLLLPGFLASVLMALSTWLMPHDLEHLSVFANILGIFWFLCSPAVMAMMTLGAFGREFSSGTFSLLLAQPVPRARIWSAKALPLAVMVALVWFAWCISFILHNPDNRPYSELRDFAIFAALYALAMYSGGLWSVLLFRQVAAGFWFAVLTPAALLMSIAYLFDRQPNKIQEGVVIAVFTVYGIAGFFFARRLFLRAQDAAWTGGEFTLPEMRGLARFKLASGALRLWRPRPALFWKELQLHQSQYVMAGALALLHLGFIGIRKIGNFQNTSITGFVLESFWMLWLVMPVLVGCAAVAEERKLGTLEGQLCLPVKRRTQFAVKLGVVLILSVLLGAVMPLLLEGTKILPGAIHLPANVDKIAGASILAQLFFQLLGTIYPWMPFIIIFSIPAVIGALAFYASSQARNTLQSFGPALLGITAAAFLVNSAWYPEGLFHYPIWRGALIYLVGLPVMIPVVARLAYGNSQRLLVGWGVWRRNLLALMAALALVIATTIGLYHRAWETFTKPDPQHGPARITTTGRVTTYGNYMAQTIGLPDGRVWLGHFSQWEGDSWAGLFPNWKIKLPPDNPGFLDGTNWTGIADSYSEIVGVKKDGSLWVSEKPAQFIVSDTEDDQARVQTIKKLVRFGGANDWTSAAGYYRKVWLVRTDGTLWNWSAPTNFNRGKSKWPGLRAFEPRRLGADSDWAKVSSHGGWLNFRKKDGRVWENIQRGSPRDTNNTIKLEKNFTLYPAPFLDNHEWQGAGWAYSRNSGWLGCTVGVRDDGTFRVQAAWEKPLPGHSYSFLMPQDTQLDPSTNWVVLAGNGFQVITLKSDGTLWLWHFRDSPVARPDTAYATRFDTHSDWIAIIGWQGDGILALAVDGSLWYWKFELPYYDRPKQGVFPPLLGPSHKPQLIGNIFGDTR